MDERKVDQSTRAKLSSQLHVLDKALEIISDIDPPADQKAKKHVLNTSHVRSSQDRSFTIDTTSAQRVTCPDCFREVDFSRLKLHRNEECGNKLVICPNVGCGVKLHKSNLPHHLSYECFTAVTRKKHLTSALEKATRKMELDTLIEDSEKFIPHATRPLEQSRVEKPLTAEKRVVFCSKCGEGMSESKLQYHTDNLCCCRAISCPNFGHGCKMLQIPLNQLASHLKNDCNAEKYKNELIARSTKRTEFILCSTCGYQLELRMWRKHEQELCENRLVPCKNEHLGCPVLVPLNERHLHESINEAYERHCLYLSGHGCCLHVDESDILYPWTAEFWLYRPVAQDSLSFHLRNFFSLLISYELAYSSECFARDRVLRIVAALKRESSSNKASTESGKGLTKQERKRLQHEQMQIKVNLLNELSSLIPIYADAVLAFFRAFQSIGICIEASLDCIRDLSTASRESWDPESEISFQDTYHSKLSSRGEEREHGVGEGLSRLFDPLHLFDRVQSDPIAHSLFIHGKSSVAQYLKFSFFEAIFSGDSNLSTSPIHQMFITEHRSIADKLGKLLGYTQLPDLPLRKFLITVILEPRLVKDHSFNVRIWNKMLDNFAALLKLDFDELQDGRIEAGLITPDATSKNDQRPQKAETKASVPNAEDRDSGDKKRRKKEREKQRRELAKLQSKAEVVSEVEEIEGGASSKLSSVGEETQPTRKDEDSKFEMKLIDRITDLLKSGCGCEIINESSTVNSLHHRSHICLSMYSGLSILFKNVSDSNTNLFSSNSSVEKDHYYELIIHSKDLDRFRNMNGHIGFVSVSSENEGVTTENEERNIFDLLRVQAITTEGKVQRGRWTHLTVTAMKEPQNRVVCMMDGSIIGNYKNCAFPLPMLSIGGSPVNLFSFSGILLDVRLWDYVRTSRQVQESMHRLIDVSLHRIDNFAAMEDSESNHVEKVQDIKQSDDYGLIAYWTMEEGPGSDFVTDVTRHRFKTRIITRFPFNYYWNGSEPGKYEIPELIALDFPPILARLKYGKFQESEVEPQTRPESGQSTLNQLLFSSNTLLRSFGDFFWIATRNIKVYLSFLSSDFGSLSRSQQAPELRTSKTASTKASKYPYYLQDEISGVASENREESVPLPSFREKNICPFELHRLRLARKGRELQNYVICPLNCTEAVKKVSLRFHVRFECPRRFVTCLFDGCNMIFPLSERARHERSECIISQDREKVLKQANLHNQPISCESCGTLVKLRSLNRHTEHECVHRLVFCPRDDCVFGKSKSESPKLPFSLLERHLKFDCTSREEEKKHFLISRSRKRSPYPRPWGILIEIKKVE